MYFKLLKIYHQPNLAIISRENKILEQVSTKMIINILFPWQQYAYLRLGFPKKQRLRQEFVWRWFTLGNWRPGTGRSDIGKKVNQRHLLQLATSVSTWAPSGGAPRSHAECSSVWLPMEQTKGALLHACPSPRGQGLLLSKELTPLTFKVCPLVRMFYVTPAVKAPKQEIWGSAEENCHQVTPAQLVASKQLE